MILNATTQTFFSTFSDEMDKFLTRTNSKKKKIWYLSNDVPITHNSETIST